MICLFQSARQQALIVHSFVYRVVSKGVFTLDVKSVLNKNLGGFLGGMQC